MPTFIKPGFWDKKPKAYEHWLNLDNLITSLIPSNSPLRYNANATGIEPVLGTNNASSAHSGILGGVSNNTSTFTCAMIIGSNITANRACTTFVNDLTIVSAAACSGCSVGISTNGLLIPIAGGGGTPVMTRDSGACSIVGAGLNNCTSGECSSILGGQENLITARFSNIGGGNINVIQSPTNECCSLGVTIGGGIGHNTVGGTFDSATGLFTVAPTSCCNAGKLSTIGGGFRNCATGACSFVGGGSRSRALGGNSTIAGGSINIASSNYSFVGGGQLNNANSNIATIGGGINNSAGNTAFIGGGQYNNASGLRAVVAGGNSNVATGNSSFVGGGSGNTASAYCSSIVGGFDNITNARLSFIGGGNKNVIQSPTNQCCSLGVTIGGGIGHNTYGGAIDNVTGLFTVAPTSCCNAGKLSTISGGALNQARGGGSTVSGGCRNYSTNEFSTIGGGFNNRSAGFCSTVSGGTSNNSNGHHSTISGGVNNGATGSVSTVGGGEYHNASGLRATVAGGSSNAATGSSSFVGGGNQNIVSATCSGIVSGLQNITNARFSNIGGGNKNVIQSPTNECCSLGTTIGGGIGHNTVGGTFDTATGLFTGGSLSCVNAGKLSTIGGGFRNIASGSYSIIAGGYCNTSTGDSTSILGGRFNTTNNLTCAMIVGSNITADRECTTFVNNLSIKTIPTTSACLPAGSVWNNGGVLNIV